MGFDIPDNDVAFNANQSIWMSADIDILTAGLNGVGVVSACGVTAQGTPDMTVAIAAGSIRIASGAIVAVTGGNGTITTADATNPRIDLISASNAGVKTVTAGTAAANPAAPALPAGNVGLAMVYVPVNDTAIAANQITDKRVVLGLTPGQEIDYAEITTTVIPSATTEATAQVVVMGNAVVYDGVTPVFIEFYSPDARPDNAASQILNIWLYDGSSSIGRMLAVYAPAAAAAVEGPIYSARRFVPSAASHTYSIRASVNAGTGAVGAGTGGGGAFIPAFIRITRA